MKKVIEIIRDLLNHIRSHQPYTTDDSWRYEYDRPKWITTHGRDGRKEDQYSQDLETLRVMIYQIHHYQHIIHTDESGRDINNNKLIEERKYEKPE